MLFLAFAIKAQITTTSVKTQPDLNENSQYDSLTNFVGINVHQYLGQTLYLKGISKILRQFGYDGFYKDPKGKSKYKCCDGSGSKYNDLNGKYYKVLEITKHPMADSKDELYAKLYSSKSILKLQEKESNDILYFEYNNESKHSFPFIVVGFFEKAKKSVINKEFIFADIVLKGSMNIETAKEVTIFTGQKWKCIDFTIDEEFFNLSLILQNPIGEKTLIGYESIATECAIKDLTFTPEQVESYSKKFGSENFDKILKGKVAIGMTKEMCLLSWGKPKKINETITANGKTEQWVYNDNYLYFENGTVITIQ